MAECDQCLRGCVVNEIRVTMKGMEEPLRRLGIFVPHFKGMAEMEDSQDSKDADTVGQGGVPQYGGPRDEIPPSSEYWERENETARFFEAQDQWLRERERMEELRKNDNSNGCEGPDQPGGKPSVPSGKPTADVVQAILKGTGGLVTNPGPDQGSSGGRIDSFPPRARQPKEPQPRKESRPGGR